MPETDRRFRAQAFAMINDYLHFLLRQTPCGGHEVVIYVVDKRLICEILQKVVHIAKVLIVNVLLLMLLFADDSTSGPEIIS